MTWPQYLHIPSVEEFRHGNFAPAGAYPDHLRPFHVCRPRDLRFKCGTQCCLVGHTAIAFNTKGYHASYIDDDGAAAAFLKEFCRRAGFPVPPGRSVGWWASDVFEDIRLHNNDDPGLTAEEAHRLWVETAARFGYTEDVSPEELEEQRG